MTPKEKAEELEERFRMNVLDYEGCSINSHKAKQFALIAIEEILNALSYKVSTNFEEIKYFVEVKQELEKL